MKSNNANPASANLFVRNFFIALLALASSVNCANGQQSTTVHDPKNGSVTYLGTNGGEMLFNLVFENSKQEKFVVSISDAEKNILYTEVFNDKKFNKKFKVPADILKLTFTITNQKTKTDQQFVVSTERRLIEEVLVTKLK